MPKILLGCLGVLVLLTVGGVGIVWYKFGDDISQGVSAVQGMAKIGTEFEELNDSIDNTSSHTPPSDGVLNEQTFERYMAAQRLMRGRLEGRLEELQQKYENIDEEIDQRGGQAGIGDVMGAYGDLADLLLDAKRAQVEALNAQDFSLEEYGWVREQVYRALGESVAVAAISGSAAAPQYQATVPEQTRNMVAPYREELMETYALAWWGL